MLIFSTIIFSGQSYGIELPQGGTDHFDFNKKHYTIHVTNQNEIYFNNNRIRFWDQIDSSILIEERVPNFNVVEDILIYADKKIDYYIIQRIKHQIGKVWQGFVHYMSNNKKKDSKCLSFYIKSSFLNRKSIHKDDMFYKQDIIYTTDEANIELDVKPPKLKAYIEFPVFAVWQPHFSKIFFTSEIETIREYLKEIKHTKILFSGYTYDPYSNLEAKEEEEEINNLIQENDLLLINVDALTPLERYFKGMIKFQQKRYKHPNHGELRKPFIIEVPYAYDLYLEKNGLDLFIIK